MIRGSTLVGALVLLAPVVFAATPADATPTAQARPSVASVSPSLGSTHARQQIVVRGTGFTPGTRVFVGPRPAAAVVLLGAHEIVAYAPPQSPGTRHVTVRTGSRTSRLVAADRYTYRRGYVPTARLVPRAAPLPSDAGKHHDFGSEDLGAFSCGSPTHCVAVGSYGASDGSRAMALVRTAHRVSVSAVPTPATSLYQVSCAGPVFCAAIGTAGGEVPVVATLSSGVWTVRRLPRVRGSGTATHDTELGGISCAAAGHCVVTAAAPPGAYVYTLSGTSISVDSLPQPANGTKDPNVEPGLVSCPTTTWCALVDKYATTHTDATMGVTLVNGNPHAVELYGPGHQIDPGIEDLVCPAIARCYGVGYYDKNGFGRIHGQFVVLSTRGWSALAVPDPADVNDYGSYLTGIACPAVASCFASGWYYTRGHGSRGQEGLLLRLQGTSVTAQTAPAPVKTAVAGQPEDLEDVVCHSNTSCVAVGRVGDSALSETWTKAGVWVPDAVGTQPHAPRRTEATYIAVTSAGYGTYLATGYGAYDFNQGEAQSARALYAVD